MFRLVGLYVVGAWVMIQVAEALFQAWGIPESAMRFVFIGAFLCFPIALVFGWIYDITSKGIVRTRAAGPDESVDISLKRTDHLILTAMLVVGIAVLAGSADKVMDENELPEGPAIVERLENSIAVLPFSNLDMNADTGYFSDGVTEEILHRLSTLRALHVLASNSSFALRNSTEGPAEIAAKLGVRYLLQGSVRREQNQVRITARLLDQTGLMVWSDTFDRDLTEIFAVQTDIANVVSREIVSEIVPFDELPAGRTTGNAEAYNAYLLGKYEADRRTMGWKQRANEAFRKAIELDPGFAPPYAGLAILVVNSALGPHWKEARETAEKSLKLDPKLAEAHAALGLITTVLGDPAAGAESLERAIELNPSYSSSYAWLAEALRRQGLETEARNALYRGLEKDPLNPILVANLADGEEQRGDFEAAEQLLLRLIGLPQLSGPSFDILKLYRDWGRYADELATGKKMMVKMGPDSAILVPQLSRNYAALGMTAEADYWLDLSVPDGTDAGTPIAELYYAYKLYDDPSNLRPHLAAVEQQVQTLDGMHRASLLGYGGMAQIQIGDFEKGIEWLETSLELYRQHYQPESIAGVIDVSIYVENWWTWLAIHMMQRLAFAYQQVDRGPDAIDILQQLDDVFGQAQPNTPRELEWRALQRGLYGDIDSAYESLSAAVELGWANYYEITNDPAWLETIKDGRVAALLAEVKLNIDQQRETVQALEEKEDFRGEVERLLSH